MPDIINFYVDDSGTRRPNKRNGRAPAHGYDWFAIGGVLIKEEDEEPARNMHNAFCQRWGIESPLHSVEIRGVKDNFAWIGSLSKQDNKNFYEELYCLLRDAPVIGLACVIDRPGYRDRYNERYGNQPWMLCKTAFSISVERAAKYAMDLNRKLRIFVERCNKAEDKWILGYYNDMKKNGMPFNKETSSKYNPAQTAELSNILYDLKFKQKTSPMIQIADLFLWPISIGGYHKGNRTYKRLMEDGKLVECVLPEGAVHTRGTKYSCFDSIMPKE